MKNLFIFLLLSLPGLAFSQATTDSKTKASGLINAEKAIVAKWTLKFVEIPGDESSKEAISGLYYTFNADKTIDLFLNGTSAKGKWSLAEENGNLYLISDYHGAINKALIITLNSTSFSWLLKNDDKDAGEIYSFEK